MLVIGDTKRRIQFLEERARYFANEESFARLSGASKTEIRMRQIRESSIAERDTLLKSLAQ